MFPAFFHASRKLRSSNRIPSACHARRSENCVSEAEGVKEASDGVSLKKFLRRRGTEREYQGRFLHGVFKGEAAVIVYCQRDRISTAEVGRGTPGQRD